MKWGLLIIFCHLALEKNWKRVWGIETYLSTFTAANTNTATTRAGVKYVFVFGNTNTNINTAYLYLYLYFYQISNHVFVFVFDPPYLVYLTKNTLSWVVF